MDKEKKKLNICVFGTGSFGTALGTVAARAGHDVTIVGRTKEIINEITESHTNSKYFPKEFFSAECLREGGKERDIESDRAWAR